MRKTVARLTAFIAAAALAGPVRGQGGGDEPLPKPVTLGDLRVLHDAGIPAAGLLDVLRKRGLTAVESDTLERARKLGFPPEVLAEIERTAAGRVLDLDAVTRMVRSGRPAGEIVAAIERQGRRIEVTEAQLVDLVVEHGAPVAVIRALRRASGPEQPPAVEPVTMEDVARMVRAGWKAERILARIRRADARFEADVERLADLAAAGVPQEVITEVWRRRRKPGEAAGPDSRPAQPETESRPAPVALRLHQEMGCGFSLTVPETWFRHQEKLGRNNLVSFTPAAVDREGGSAAAELQIARFRSRHPDRLTETNLRPIAENFVNHLKVNLRKRGMNMVTDPGVSTHVSGRPAIAYRATTSSSDGPTQRGEVIVTWAGTYVYLLSFAVETRTYAEDGPLLESCLRSFTLEGRDPLPEPLGTAREKLAALFEAWKTSVTTWDYGTYRELLAPGSDSAGLRRRFATLCRTLSRNDVRLSLGDVHLLGDGRAEVVCRVVSPSGGPTERTLVFEPRDGRFRLVVP